MKVRDLIQWDILNYNDHNYVFDRITSNGRWMFIDKQSWKEVIMFSSYQSVDKYLSNNKADGSKEKTSQHLREHQDESDPQIEQS